MSSPNERYFFDKAQGRYYRPNATYNHQTKQWESQWMRVGWQPPQQEQQTQQGNPIPPGSPAASSRPNNEVRRDLVIPTSPSNASRQSVPRSNSGSATVETHARFDSVLSVPGAWHTPTDYHSQYPPESNYEQGSGSNSVRTGTMVATGYHQVAPSGGSPTYNHEFPRGRGGSVKGFYNTALPPSQENPHYEEVDPSYYVREESFFHEGRVLSIILTEPAGSTVTSYNSAISEARYKGNYVHTQSRRFVVVRRRRGFCFACPIFTYSKRATTKRGVRPEEHGVAYSWGQNPQLVLGETGITKASIAVAMVAGEPNLQVESRIYYGIHHPIQYNVKVKDIGHVIEAHVPTLIGNWMEEEGKVSTQAHNIAPDRDEPQLGDLIEDGDGAQDTGDRFAFHPQNNPQGFHPKRNPNGYHPNHNQYGYHPELSPYCYHVQFNPRGYHSELNPEGHHPQTNPHGYHPKHNPYGFNSTANPYSYHPVANPYGYHPQYNQTGHHAEVAPFCYHPKFNPQGYHVEINPRVFHPQANPYVYHPQNNPHVFDKQSNIYGFHPQYNKYGYHPDYNRYGWHPQNNQFGYHLTYNPQAYHPDYNTNGVYRK
ncbi:hypothetical protein BKA66DRAFT_149905 [Pyrenochaeta sp. MPI-SDFR-AT-0127]|nr:hypothetical protein BKA66DRAFT_149905 [Pyrenochaeta sp. MPI-SDFR-AT-0127]